MYVDPAARAREDDQMRKSDRAVARLAAAELAKYAGVDEFTAWSIFTRTKALRASGEAEDDIRARLGVL